MHIQISGKQIDIGETLRGTAEAQLTAAAAKYFPAAIDGHVTFSRAGTGYRADCSVHAGRSLNVHAHAAAFDIHAALDEAVARLEKQLRRYKRYLSERGQARTSDGVPAQDYVLAGGEETSEEVETLNPTVVAEEARTIERLSVGEAVMSLDLSGRAALMFHNAAHGGLNVVYRRPDGNIGWIDARPAGMARG